MTFKDYYQSLTDKKMSALIEKLTRATGKHMLQFTAG